jgi:hypothetical protein
MEIQEYAVNPAEAAETARKDFNFLAALAMPEDFLFPFPAFFLTLFTLLTGFKKRIEKFAIGIPRGFAKTTFIKILCVWYVLFSSKHFIPLFLPQKGKQLAFLQTSATCLALPTFGGCSGIGMPTSRRMMQ